MKLISTFYKTHRFSSYLPLLLLIFFLPLPLLFIIIYYYCFFSGRIIGPVINWGEWQMMWQIQMENPVYILLQLLVEHNIFFKVWTKSWLDSKRNKDYVWLVTPQTVELKFLFHIISINDFNPRKIKPMTTLGPEHF